MELKNRVALVTGGGRGIGRETAILLAKHGAKVAVFSRGLDEIIETTEIIRREYGGDTIAVAGDVSKEEDVNRAIQQVEERLGPVDILVNNAGVMSLKPVEEVSTDEWDFVHDVNVKGSFLFAKAVIPNMKAKQDGVIVNISSIWGTKGGPNRSPYISSKWAVIGLTKALGEELKPDNIRVNVVCPGPVATKMTENLAPNLNRDNWLEPVDLANVIVDLCLPKSKAITATTIEAFGVGSPVGQ